MKKLLDELTISYLENAEEESYLDPNSLEIMIDWDQAVTGELGIDWGDEKTDDYLLLPTIDSHESYELMEEFTNQVDDLVKAKKLLASLQGKKPFRHFKDCLDEVGLRDEWFTFEENFAKNVMAVWLEENGVEYS